jgi:hypothetical protein
MKEILDRSGIRYKFQKLGLPESTGNNITDTLHIVGSFFAGVCISATAFSQIAIISPDDT